MSTPAPAHPVPPRALLTTGRVAGLCYLGLAVTGLLGFIVVRSRIFDQQDAAATLEQLVGNEILARTGIALELGIVVAQALTALWFFRLFRPVDPLAAGAIAVFGMVNAVTILISAAFLGTALEVALDPVGDPAVLAQVLYLVSGNLWVVGAVFFGLWLIPMGLCVLRSGWMPALLGRILVVGGVGYVLSGFLHYLLPDAGLLADLLTVPASIGEFWMIGHLLIRGAGSGRRPEVPAVEPLTAAGR